MRLGPIRLWHDENNSIATRILGALLCGYVLALAATITAFRLLDPDPDVVPSPVQQELLPILHAVQVGIILVVWLLIARAARVSRERYLAYWTKTWLILLAYYIFLFLSSAYAWDIADGLNAAITLLLVLPSTGFVLLTGLHALSKRRTTRDDLWTLAGLVSIYTLSVLALRAVSPGVDWGIVVRFADGAMGCVCAIFAGICLWLYARPSRRIRGALEVLPAFVFYGLIQLGAPLAVDATYAQYLFPAALILKVPCALSVVAIALLEVFGWYKEEEAQLQKKSLQLQNTNRDLKESGRKLGEQHQALQQSLQETEQARQVADLQRRAFQRLGAIVMEANQVTPALSDLLDVVLDLVGVQKGIMYLRCEDSSQPEPFCVLASTHGVSVPTDGQGFFLKIGPNQSPKTHTVSADNDTAESQLISARVHPYFNATSDLYAISLKPPAANTLGWILFASEADDLQQEVVTKTVDDVVNRIAIGIELILHRELFDLLQSLRRDLREGRTLRDRLHSLAELAATTVGARSCIIEAKEAASDVRYRAAWPFGAQPVDQRTTSFPSKPQFAWSHGCETATSEEDEGAHSSLNVPIPGVEGGVVGVIACRNRRSDLAPTSVAPFTPYDLRRLELLADFVGWAMDRARRLRTIEVLLARGVHELRSPVGSLRNIVRWLQKHLSIPRTEKAWKKLQDAAADVELLRHQVDLVDINRGEAKEKTVKLKLFAHSIGKAMDQLRPRLIRLGIPSRHVRLAKKGVQNVPALQLRPSAIEQVINNLIDNAVKYRAKNEFRLEIEGDVDQEFYLVRIRDWGIGIPRGWEDRVFEDGVRAPNATRLRTPGMGVGLHLARQLARSMKADLVLAHRHNPTEFILKFPKELADDSIRR